VPDKEQQPVGFRGSKMAVPSPLPFSEKLHYQ